MTPVINQREIEKGLLLSATELEVVVDSEPVLDINFDQVYSFTDLELVTSLTATSASFFSFWKFIYPSSGKINCFWPGKVH